MAAHIKYILSFVCNKKGISEEAFPTLSSAKLGNENWFLGAMLQKLWVLLRNSAFKIQLDVSNCRGHKHSQQGLKKKPGAGVSHNTAAFISLLITGADVSAIWPVSWQSLNSQRVQK